MSSIIKSPQNLPASYIIKQQEEAPGPMEMEEETTTTDSAEDQAMNIIEQAKKEREHILQQAEAQKQEAEEYIRQQREEWEEEKEKIAQEYSQIGYQEGYGEGKRTANQEYEEVLRQVKETLSRTKEQEEKLLEEMEPQLLEVGIRIANKILNHSLEEEPARFLHVVKRVIQEVKEENDIKIYIHPSFYELVSEKKEDLKILLHQDAMLTLYPDEKLEETQCIVESSFGRIEGCVDSQLEQIKQALRKIREG